MSNLDANIPDFFNTSIQVPGYVTPVGESLTESEVDSGLSSIEKSKGVVVPVIPPFGSPILPVPTHTAELFLMSQGLKLDEIKQSVLNGWSESIAKEKEAMEQHLRSLLQNPQYQELQMIRVRGDPKQGNVSGVETVTAANGASSNPVAVNVSSDSLISTINHLHAFQRIPPVATIPDSTDPTDVTKMLTIPLVASLFAGGALALGSMDVSVSSAAGLHTAPLTGSIEIIERLQPVLPQLVPDLIPMINLMVMPLIYYTSWDHAVGSLRHKEAENNRATVQDFARQVIKMINDPTFILLTIVNKMENSAQLNPEQKSLLTNIIKLLLSSIALTLLYSFEVGKIQNGKFWGMEPQEFQGLLSGKIPSPDPNDPKLNSQQQLTATLLSIVKTQLNALSPAIQANVIAVLFDYLASGRHLQSMLEPSKVFRDILHNSEFNSEIESFETKSV